MPRGDGTGPMGFGPMTGRAAGYCAGFAVPGFMNPIPGRGFGGGWGRGFRGGGRGWRNMYYATGLPGWARFGAAAPAWGGVTPYGAPAYPYAAQPSRERELEALKAQAEYFEDALDGIKKRIEELDVESEK